MRCPKCGLVQPTSPQCIECGIIVARYRPDAERIRHIQQELAREAEQAKADPYRRPIRFSMRVLRTAAGFLGLLFGGWLFLAGQKVDLAPLHVLFLIGYGCVSLFWILSAPLRVSIRQFAIEMLVFVCSTLLLRVALPGVFSLGSLSYPPSAGSYYGGHSAESPDPTVEEFVSQADGLADGARDLLQTRPDADRSEDWLETAGRLRTDYRELGRADRKRCEPVYKALVALETRMEQKPSAVSPDEVREQTFRAIEEVERSVVALGP